jgi:cobalt-zinc-cadmium efflux system outer membrane protein
MKFQQTSSVFRCCHGPLWRLTLAVLAVGCLTKGALAQRTFTWPEIRDRFRMVNPTLLAGQINLQESKAQEITANLRPNPDFTSNLDQINPFTAQPSPNGSGNSYSPFAYAEPYWSTSYLIERAHKRGLRLESAQKGTAVAESQQADLERNLLFNLHTAFVQTLQAKAVLALAQENLTYYDQMLSVSNDRFKAGDIAQVDLDRLQVQRIQYESDVQTGTVNLRTAKIQLLALLNDRTPVEQFDVTGRFEDFREPMVTQEQLRAVALANRPDLQAAARSIDKAQTDYRLAVANGSTDPTVGMDFARNPPIPVYLGFSVTIPLRIFDRNQGEKARTQLDIGRNQRLREAAEAQVFSDVDSALATVNSNLTLLRRYKSTYLQQAGRVRDTIAFSYQRGGASLLDFLNAQSDYRTVRLNYLNLVGSYLTAGVQLNLATGQEVIE